MALWQPSAPGWGAATLLPNGEQCFSATTPTSGGTFGPISTLGTITGGGAYVSGTYTNVPLTGGSGTGARATIVVIGGVVNVVTLTNAGQHYSTADTLSAANANLGGSGAGFSIPVTTVTTTGTGMVGLLGPITGGTGGAAGLYGGVTLTGGAGSGATANITVSGGAVTAVQVLNPGAQYQVGDVLSASAGTIGGTTGFSVSVSSIAVNSSLAGGSVGMYVPNTNNPKVTYFNADAQLAHQNPNPIPLDANGCAIIYGTGIYRQVLQDSLGNTVWDQITTDTSANNNYFWAGTAGGTANVITVNDPGFNGTDGSVIGFIALSSNTGVATLNPSGFGAVAIKKDTTAGPVPLVGGEIIQNNTVEVVYRTVDASFHILNPVIQSASGSNAPLCGTLGLSIVNDNVTPNTVVDVSYKNGVSVSALGQAINRSNVSFKINFGVIGAPNGLDQGALAVSSIYYLYIIDNGATAAGLASLSSTSPLLPAGYSYSCRIGAIPSQASGNLYSIVTAGATTQIITSLVGTPFVTNTVTGTCTSTYTATTISLFPPTATQMVGRIFGAGNTNISIGRSASGPELVTYNPGTALTSFSLQFFSVISTPQTFYYCNSNTSNAVVVHGWIDSVNAD